MKFKLYFGGTLEADSSIDQVEALVYLPKWEYQKVIELILGERYKDEEGDVWERVA